MKPRPSSGETIKKTKISNLKYKYVDHQKEEEDRVRQEENLKRLNDSDYESTMHKEEQIDFSKEKINEQSEIIVNVKPTFGVSFEAININNDSMIKSPWKNNSHSKVKGLTYNQMPNLKMKLSRPQYHALRRVHNFSMKDNPDKDLINNENTDLNNYLGNFNPRESRANYISIDEARPFSNKGVRSNFDKLEMTRQESNILPQLDPRVQKATKILIDNTFSKDSYNPATATNKSLFSEKLIQEHTLATSQYADYNMMRRLKMKRNSRTSHSRNKSQDREFMKSGNRKIVTEQFIPNNSNQTIVFNAVFTPFKFNLGFQLFS